MIIITIPINIVTSHNLLFHLVHHFPVFLQFSTSKKMLERRRFCWVLPPHHPPPPSTLYVNTLWVSFYRAAHCEVPIIHTLFFSFHSNAADPRKLLIAATGYVKWKSDVKIPANCWHKMHAWEYYHIIIMCGWVRKSLYAELERDGVAKGMGISFHKGWWWMRRGAIESCSATYRWRSFCL